VLSENGGKKMEHHSKSYLTRTTRTRTKKYEFDLFLHLIALKTKDIYKIIARTLVRFSTNHPRTNSYYFKKSYRATVLIMKQMRSIYLYKDPLNYNIESYFLGIRVSTIVPTEKYES